VEQERLLSALADGHAHSGEELARALGVTRTAVWKRMTRLAEWGLDVVAVPGVGYRLTRPLDLVEPADLRAALADRVAVPLVDVEVLTEVDSTNRRLVDRPPPAGSASVCLAEFQRAGRGRRGRVWHAPLGGGLCLSVGWQFADMPADLPALTLAVGVVVRRALAHAAGIDVALKWPNDLVWGERKLGGILLDLAAEAQGGCHVVAGVGLNVSLPTELLPAICDWPRGAVDLATAMGRAPPRRGALAVEVISALVELFAAYADAGFAAYRDDWRDADFLKGRRVRLESAAGTLAGTAIGIEADGALIVETAAGCRERIISGDVTVRAD
jgi:BirA family transcriptional regulator, biotin operon repressor / biotin---[acetyl-CoA-carboxylase] ligase